MLAFAQYQRLYSRRRCRDRDLAMARELDGQTCAVRQGLQTLQQFEPAPVGLLRWFVVVRLNGRAPGPRNPML